MLRTLRVAAVLTAAFAVVTTAACKKTDETSSQSTTTTPAPAPAPTPPAEENFSARMDGLSERPTTLNTGAAGTADFTITSGGIKYSIAVTGLSSNPTGMHIHGPADANATADPIVSFDSLPQTLSGKLSAGTIDATRMAGRGISIDSLKALIRNGMAYVNVHTANHKDGEIRGQIVRR